jgi:hypothetical protein
MPNHCSNNLYVTGPLSIVFDFCRDHYRKEPGGTKKYTLDFSVHVAEPVIENHDWYNWRVENWGTKWNAYDISPDTFPEVLSRIVEKDNNASILYSFTTAWSPPIPWVLKMSPNYPLLTFSLDYQEPSMDFCGIYTVQNGELIGEHEARMSSFAPENVDWDDDQQWEHAWDTIAENVEEMIDDLRTEHLTNAAKV